MILRGEDNSRWKEVAGDCHLRWRLAGSGRKSPKEGLATAAGGGHGVERRRRKEERESLVLFTSLNTWCTKDLIDIYIPKYLAEISP